MVPYYKIRHCEHCGESVLGTRSDTKYCSPKCKQAAYRKRRGAASRNSYADTRNSEPEASISLPTLRAALRLYQDLDIGKMAVLDELFPHVRQIPHGQPQAAPRTLVPRPDKPPDFEIKQASSSADDKPTWNFMISSALSVYGHCNFLPADIRAYGVMTGRIAPEKGELPASNAGSGNAKKMVVPQFETPTFDDEAFVA